MSRRDATLDAATAEARKLRLQRQETLDAKVRRAHEAGSTCPEIARMLGISPTTARKSLLRQHLAVNRDALFAQPSKAVSVLCRSKVSP